MCAFAITALKQGMSMKVTFEKILTEISTSS